MNPEPQKPAGTSDPYQRLRESVQEPPRTFWPMFRQIGPGLILTASIVGTGELIATTNLGAKAGFALLWLVLLSCFVKVFLQIELGRYAISSGDTTLASFHQIPRAGSFLCWWWLGMMFCTQFQIGAMVGGCGYALYLAIPPEWAEGAVELAAGISPQTGGYLRERPEIPWAFLVALVTVVLLVRGRYPMVERVTTILVALFTVSTVLCMVLLPWVHIAPAETRDAATMIGLFGTPGGIGPLHGIGALAPVPTDDSAIWLAAFAMIGITGVGASELIAYPYWCLEKGYGRHIGPRNDSPEWAERAQGWMRVMQADAWLSMVIYTLATLAFYVLGAAVLYAHTRGVGLPGTVGAMLDTLARMYEPVLGRQGSILFIMIGGFIVLYSTLFAATAGNSRVASDFLRNERFIPSTPPEYRQRWVRLFCAAFPLLGLGLFLTVGNPVQMVVIGGIAQAITLPILGAVAIFLRRRRTDPRLVKPGWWDVLLWISLIMFTIAAAYGLWEAAGAMMR